MSKLGILTRVKGLFLALLVVTLGVLIVIPLTSLVTGESPVVHHMTIYTILLIAWILLAVVFGIALLASTGSKVLQPIPLPVNKEEEA